MVGPRTSELSIEEMRTVQLEVLSEFDHVCRNHQLTYYLAYGTLLGAIRHGGYIPWDDDVDVMMPRADYDRLLDVFAAAAPEHLSLSSQQTRADWPFAFAKIGDERTELWEPLQDPLALAVNIDVFPLDALPANQFLRRTQAKVLRFLRWAVELRYIEPQRGRNWHGPLAIHVGKPLVRLVPVEALITTFTRAARGWGTAGDRVGVRVGSYDWSAPAVDLGTPTEIAFEQLPLLAPAEPQAVLTAIYGDYRELPPEAARISEHAFTANWRTTG